MQISETDNPDLVYTAFVDWASGEGFDLYPAQDEAIMELVSCANVILSTLTGTGMSLVVVAAHVAALAAGKRSFYMAPIKSPRVRKVLRPCRHLRRGEGGDGHW